jgi:hypothetical protein
MVTSLIAGLWVWKTRSTPSPWEILRDGKGGIQAAVADGDDDPFVGLHALTIAFHDLDLHAPRCRRA